MSKNKFKAGDRVVVYQTVPFTEWDEPKLIEPRFVDTDLYNTTAWHGSISKVDGKLYHITFDEGNDEYGDPPDDCKVKSKLLVAENDEPVLQKTLEKEFRATEKLIADKIKEASASILEANKLSNKIGYSLSEIDHHGLYSAMDKAGWKTSSFDC
jgi:hypothetical protein